MHENWRLVKKDYGGVTTTPAKHGRGFFMVRQAWRAAPIRRYPVRRGGWPDDLGVKVPYGP